MSAPTVTVVDESGEEDTILASEAHANLVEYGYDHLVAEELICDLLDHETTGVTTLTFPHLGITLKP